MRNPSKGGGTFRRINCGGKEDVAYATRHAGLTKRIGDKIQLVGDDLFVTNTKRLNAYIKLLRKERWTVRLYT